MGNEIYYCTECGARASGSDFAPGTSGFGAERSLCPACLGLPVVSRRDSTKKIRKPASGMVTAIAVRPRTVPVAPPKRAFASLIGAAVLLAAGAVVALVASPVPPPEAPVPSIPLVTAPAPPAIPVPVDPPPSAAPTAAGAPEGKRCGYAQRVVRPEPDPVLESKAEAAFAEIEEAATALADEGRAADALARISRFPETYRPTRAWANLQRLRVRIEQRLQ